MLLAALLLGRSASGLDDPVIGPLPEAEAAVTATAVVRQGLEIGFEVVAAEAGRPPIEGQDATFRFTIKDAASGRPLSGLYPAAWIDRRESEEAGLGCEDKVRSFLQGSLAFRPAIDLNTWHIVTLNEAASLSVIDPLIGYGGQRLLAQVPLAGAGQDWALTERADRLFVSLPTPGQIVAVDTSRWKVAEELSLDGRPGRIALQPDEQYLWVGLSGRPGEAAEGTAVLDRDTLEVVARIDTGRGPRSFAFTRDSRYAFVTNAALGTLSVVDVHSLEKVADLRVGARPEGLAFSALSQAVYVADRESGEVTVVDARGHEVRTRLSVGPGIAALRFDPDGRWGFAVNPAADEVVILDPSLNRVAHRLKVAAGPEQVAFSEAYAYVRSARSETISLIELGALDKDAAPAVVQIQGGRTAPGATDPVTAPAVSITPEENSVLIANPADGVVYYYMEGMNAPMGSYRTRSQKPKAVRAVDSGLRERTNGVYAADARLPEAGSYDVAFLLDRPRILHCFRARVHADPAAEQSAGQSVSLQFLLDTRTVTVAEESRLRLKLTDGGTLAAKDQVRDLRVLATLSPGVWQRRSTARPLGDGIYEVVLSPPRAGLYYLFFESASLGLNYDALPTLVLRAEPADREPAEGRR